MADVENLNENNTGTDNADETETTEGGGDVAQVKPVVSVEMMLYEAGMIANALSSKTLGSALAQRLFDEEQTAEAAGHSRLTVAFSPFEAGMALDGMSRTVDGSLDDLKNALGSALAEKMQELGIGGIDRGHEGGLGGSEGGLGGDTTSSPTDPTPAPAEEAPAEESPVAETPVEEAPADDEAVVDDEDKSEGND